MFKALYRVLDFQSKSQMARDTRELGSLLGPRARDVELRSAWILVMMACGGGFLRGAWCFSGLALLFTGWIWWELGGSMRF